MKGSDIMFNTDARVDLAIYEFNSGVPVYFGLDVKSAVFNSPSKAIQLKDPKHAPNLLIQKPQINSLEVVFNGLDEFVLPKLVPLESVAATPFVDFLVGTDNVPIPIPPNTRIIQVERYVDNLTRQATTDYEIKNGNLVFANGTGLRTVVLAEFNAPCRTYEFNARPSISTFYRLQVKQQIRDTNGKREVLTITIPKTQIAQGLDFFLSNLGKIKATIPLIFTVLHDCDEPTTFRFWEE